MTLDFDRIQLQMAKRKWSQTDFAKAYRANQTFVSRLFRRIREGREIQPVTARRIADTFGIKIERLLPSPNGQKAGTL